MKMHQKLKGGNNNFMNITQQGLANGNFSILLHFLTRKTQRRKPLIDYSQSHVVISKEYMSRL
jgi:hypothetical protein